MHCNWPRGLSSPYAAECSKILHSKFKDFADSGITVTAPGFYGPQFRNLRLEQEHPKLIESISTFKYQGLYVLNFEMETSGIYGFSSVLGHNALAIYTVIANRKSMDNLILKTLNTWAG